MMNYDEIKRMLSEDGLCKLIPDGLILSEPIWGIEDDLPVVNFFVMSRYQQKRHPLYKFSLSVEKKQLITFSEYTNSACYGNDNIIGLTIEEFIQYKDLFQKTGDMYYGMIKAKPEILCEYMKLLLKLVPPSLVNHYNDLSPHFFAWVRETIELT